jgi:hypothetical protein
VTTKERLHQLVEELSEQEALAALAVVERGLQDPVLMAFAGAPEDDETVTAEDEAALEEADADIAAGRTVSLDELERRYDAR